MHSHHYIIVRILSISALLTTIVYYALAYTLIYIIHINYPLFLFLSKLSIFTEVIVWTNLAMIIIPCLLLSLYPEELHFTAYLIMLTISAILSEFMYSFYYFLGWYPSFLGLEALFVGYIIKNSITAYSSRKPILSFILILVGGGLIFISSLYLLYSSLFIYPIHNILMFYIFPFNILSIIGSIVTIITSFFIYKGNEKSVKLSATLAMLFSTLASIIIGYEFLPLPVIGGILAIVWKPFEK